MGLRLAARRAGKKPKTTPTPAENRNARATIAEVELERQAQRTGRRVPTRQCEADTDGAAEDGQDDGFDQELRQHVALERADGETNADLSGALRHRHEHDVHDPDAADQQTDRGDGGE